MQFPLVIKRWWWMIVVIAVSLFIMIAIWQTHRKVKQLDRQLNDAPVGMTPVFIQQENETYAIPN
jgi:hypothetical protein